MNRHFPSIEKFLEKIQSRYDTEAMRDELSSAIDLRSAFFRERGLGIRYRDPIFVLGLPS